MGEGKVDGRCSSKIARESLSAIECGIESEGEGKQPLYKPCSTSHLRGIKCDVFICPATQGYATEFQCSSKAELIITKGITSPSAQNNNPPIAHSGAPLLTQDTPPVPPSTTPVDGAPDPPHSTSQATSA